MSTRREFLVGATVSATAPALESVPPAPLASAGYSQVDHIPVRWMLPQRLRPGANAVVWLNHLGGGMDALDTQLSELAGAGYLAVSFDTWQHGRRAAETEDQILGRVFGGFRRHMWPILGQSALDARRVLDWMGQSFPISSGIQMGGISMGGDIAVAVAGIDPRIHAVAAIVATPDWLRPGMRDLFEPTKLLDAGDADAYAAFFYDALDPISHLGRYNRQAAISFECAADDTHVPPEGALRFAESLRRSGSAAEVRVQLHPNRNHRQLRDPIFWNESLAWFDRHSNV